MSWNELSRALESLSKIKSDCNSSIYPCPPEQIGLNVIGEMQDQFKVDVGFSDHSMGYAACLAAVTLGASCIEKHLTFSQKMYGSDASLAMEPSEFATLSREIRFLEKAIVNPVTKGSSYDYSSMKNISKRVLLLGMILSLVQQLRKMIWH